MHCTHEDLQMTQCIKFNGLPTKKIAVFE